LRQSSERPPHFITVPHGEIADFSRRLQIFNSRRVVSRFATPTAGLFPAIVYDNSLAFMSLFQCIGGGCLAARARAAKTYHDEVPLQEPNEHFTTCCSVLGVPQSCLQMCTFDGYNMTSSLAFGIPCPATALPQIQFCAARGADHSDCCRAAGVSSQCLVFCDQTRSKFSSSRSDVVALSHLQCLERFDSMKDCFVEHALTEYYRGKQAALDQTHKSHLT
ncbi:unnamed protein product, partial [Heligmosomoides polygyrus]